MNGDARIYLRYLVDITQSTNENIQSIGVHAISNIDVNKSLANRVVLHDIGNLISIRGLFFIIHHIVLK
jgi:hypothetical protein